MSRAATIEIQVVYNKVQVVKKKVHIFKGKKRKKEHLEGPEHHSCALGSRDTWTCRLQGHFCFWKAASPVLTTLHRNGAALLMDA